MMIETLFRFLPLPDASTLFRYEKISNLIDSLERTFEAQGYDNFFFSADVQVFYVAITGTFGSPITSYFRSKKEFFV